MSTDFDYKIPERTRSRYPAYIPKTPVGKMEGRKISGKANAGTVLSAQQKQMEEVQKEISELFNWIADQPKLVEEYQIKTPREARAEIKKKVKLALDKIKLAYESTLQTKQKALKAGIFKSVLTLKFKQAKRFKNALKETKNELNLFIMDETKRIQNLQRKTKGIRKPQKETKVVHKPEDNNPNPIEEYKKSVKSIVKPVMKKIKDNERKHKEKIKKIQEQLKNEQTAGEHKKTHTSTHIAVNRKHPKS